MIRVNIKLVVLVGLILLLGACSLQKRKYRDGFYVNWFGKQKQKQENLRLPKATQSSAQQTNKTELNEVKQVTVQASANSKITPLKAERMTLFKSTSPDSCDLLIFRDGTETKAKILEIAGDNIKYKRCDFADGPDYTVSKGKVFMAKFSNGTKQLFQSTTTNNDPPSRNGHAVKNNYRKTHPLAILSLIFGLFAITGILAIIFGNIAVRKIDEQPEIYEGRGLARAGFVLGCIRLGLILLYMLILFAAI